MVQLSCCSATELKPLVRPIAAEAPTLPSITRMLASSAVSGIHPASFRAVSPSLGGVGSYPCVIHGSVGLDLAVSDDYRDAGIHSFLQNGVPSSRLDRSNDDVIHFLCDEVTNCFQLRCVVVIAVDQGQLKSVLLREGVLIVLGVGGTPVRLMTNLGVSNSDQFAILGP